MTPPQVFRQKSTQIYYYKAFYLSIYIILSIFMFQGDGTRGFYESLYEENPNSLIAIKFCVEYGIFGGSKHDEVLHKYTQLQKNGHFKGAAGAIKPSAITFLQKLKAN